MLPKSFLLFYAASLALAAPAADSRQKNGVTASVPANLNPNYKPHAGRALHKVLRKFKLDRHVPPHIRAKYGAHASYSYLDEALSNIDKWAHENADRILNGRPSTDIDDVPPAGGDAGRTQTGTIGANPNNSVDDEYLSEVIIGGQKFNLQFDTGSSDLWVYSVLLPSNQSRGHTDLFDPSKSKTWKKMDGYNWTIEYADGSYASGETVGTDIVNVGGAVFEQQVVELATDVSIEFTNDTSSDGLLGLALDSINTVLPTPAKTFLSNIAPSLKMGLVAADLKHDQNGTFDFGYLDSSKYTGEIKYVDIITANGFWEFPSVEYSFGDQTFTGLSNCTAIADTGTTLLLMTESAVTNYYKSVTGAVFDNDPVVGGYIYPCNTTLPDVTLSIGKEHKATIPGKLLTYMDELDGKPGMCSGALQGVGGEDQMIFGDFFMKSYFSIFDYDNKRFGFASKPTATS